MQSLWMLLASFLFAAMGVCVKLAADLYTTSEIVMYRGMMGAAMLFVLSRLRGDSMRITPHLYNDAEDRDRLVEALAAAQPD